VCPKYEVSVCTKQLALMTTYVLRTGRSREINISQCKVLQAWNELIFQLIIDSSSDVDGELTTVFANYSRRDPQRREVSGCIQCFTLHKTSALLQCCLRKVTKVRSHECTCSLNY